jgi:hypothetical protein
MGCSSGLGNYFDEEAAGCQERSLHCPGQLEPVTALVTRPGRPTRTRRAGRAATQHSAAADDQALDPDRHGGTPAREPAGTSRQVTALDASLTRALTRPSTRAPGHSPSSCTPPGEACRFTSSRRRPSGEAEVDPSATAHSGAIAPGCATVVRPGGAVRTGRHVAGMACRMQCLSTDEEETMREDRRPIGYWLKHLDGLIEAAVERALAGQGVTRRHGQALNTLQERPST